MIIDCSNTKLKPTAPQYGTRRTQYHHASYNHCSTVSLKIATDNTHDERRGSHIHARSLARALHCCAYTPECRSRARSYWHDFRYFIFFIFIYALLTYMWGPRFSVLEDVATRVLRPWPVLACNIGRSKSMSIIGGHATSSIFQSKAIEVEWPCNSVNHYP